MSAPPRPPQDSGTLSAASNVTTGDVAPDAHAAPAESTSGENATLRARIAELEAENAALKHLEAENAALKARNADLEARSADLEAENAELKQITTTVRALESGDAQQQDAGTAAAAAPPAAPPRRQESAAERRAKEEKRRRFNNTISPEQREWVGAPPPKAPDVARLHAALDAAEARAASGDALYAGIYGGVLDMVKNNDGFAEFCAALDALPTDGDRFPQRTGDLLEIYAAAHEARPRCS